MTLTTMSPVSARSISRFLNAQRVIYPRILREISTGRKRTHWMWFVFPQLRGLAKSETARYYGIADRDEALAYLENPVLRLRLGECTVALLRQQQLMFDGVDTRKLHACMTLFREVAVDPSLPNAVLTKFFGGVADQRTLDLLAGKTIEPETAMGRVEMGRHWEKQVARAKAAVASVGRRPEPDRPMDRSAIESFVRGFNLSRSASKLLVEKWIEDQELAREAGWDAHADSVYYDEH